MGLTGLPHPDFMHQHATHLMSSLNINLDLSPEQQEHVQNAFQFIAQIMMYIAAAFVAYIVFTIVAMCMYKQHVHDHKPKIPEEGCKTMESGKFHYGLLDCFSNINECMCATCCTALRFADTHSAVTSTGFWCAFWKFIVVNSLISTLAVVLVGMAHPGMDQETMQTNNNISQLLAGLGRGVLWGISSRGALRKRLGDPNPAKDQIRDVLAWGFLPCCALVQESVEADIAADVSISCPWTMTKGRGQARAREVMPSDYERMVGDAVLLDGR